jgi:ankyrin repeat protein
MSPMHWAASDGQDAIINPLLDAGASVDATDREGLTALHFAAENGWDETVGLLLEHGADIDAAGGDVTADSDEEMTDGLLM